MYLASLAVLAASIPGSSTGTTITVTCIKSGGTWPPGQRNITLAASYNSVAPCNSSGTARTAALITVSNSPVVSITPVASVVAGRRTRSAGCGQPPLYFIAQFRVTAVNTGQVTFLARLDGAVCDPPPGR